MIWISLENAIRVDCLFLHVAWQTCKEFMKFLRSYTFHSIAKPPSSISPATRCRFAASASRSKPACT